jgi:cytochrome c peroxidase
MGIVITLVGGMMLVTAPAKSQSGDITDADLTPIELLGKYVFFDKISTPRRQACVTCHEPSTGGTANNSLVNLFQVAIRGANPHTVGSLKPPTNAYATFIEPFHKCNSGGLGAALNHCGGNFWNGRAEGNETPLFPNGATKHIGNEIFYATDGTPLAGTVSAHAVYFGPTADQALNPFPNPVEQNIDRQDVCKHVKKAKYAPLYKLIWGVDIDCSDTIVAVHAPDVDAEKAFDISFKRIVLAICAWQASADLNSFSSKRDKALQRELAGIDIDDTPGQFPLVGLTAQENYGHDLFYATRFRPLPNGKFSNCAFCHSDSPATDNGAEPQQLYAADDYHNIGTPFNPEIPDTGIDSDLGIAGHTGPDFPKGFFKTPTLRNVDKRPHRFFIRAYTHNGWFKSLESIVHFYNTAFLGNATTPYTATTASTFGVTRCPADVQTERQALKKNCWPAPAYDPPSAIPFLVGNLKLTAEDEAALVAYLKTLTDEHTPKKPKPYKPATIFTTVAPLSLDAPAPIYLPLIMR